MKKIIFILIVSSILQSCWRHGDDDPVNFPPGEAESSYEPVTLNRQNFESTISVGAARSIEGSY